MGAAASVGQSTMILRPVRPGVSVGAADHELARGVHVQDVVVADQLARLSPARSRRAFTRGMRIVRTSSRILSCICPLRLLLAQPLARAG